MPSLREAKHQDGDRRNTKHVFHKAPLQKSAYEVMLGSDGRRYRPHAPQARRRKDIIMMSKKKFMAAVMRGFEVSGMNALAQAGYSEATTKAFEAIENR